MVIDRLPPYPLTATYNVPEDDSDYIFIIEDTSEPESIFDVVVTAEVGSTSVSITLPDDFSKYDKSYALSAYQVTSYEDTTPIYDTNDPVIEDNLTIERPYVNPSTLATTASAIAAKSESERLARAIIDAITGGFYFSTKNIEGVGQGTDYFPVWDRVYKVLKAYENSSLVYDSSQETPALDYYNYLVTKDRTSIIKDPAVEVGVINRYEQKPLELPIAASDSYFDVYLGASSLFPVGYDYIFKVEHGYKVVPMDIQDACLMLISDIECGKLDYFKRYVTSYSTDQFRLQFDKSILNGTGNLLVDKILDKYITNFKRPGVL